ncbi:MAG: hypothetical protein NT023_23955 [Armatimonadetes bacterium]|nr:hypothetical protein [Armatimonadota bacterium]
MGTARKLESGVASPEKREITPQFTLQGRKYAFRAPIHVTIEQEDGVLIACADYKLYGHGSDFQEANECLLEAFAFLYEQYALEDDSMLSRKARALKQRLLNEVAHG